LIDVTNSKYVARVMHPRPVAVLISISSKGLVNGCTVAWFTPVNVSPFIYAVSLSYRRLTYKYVKESRQATLNIIPYAMLKEAHYVGSVSGEEVPDKLSKAGLELEYSEGFKVPHIKGVPAYVESVLKDELRYEDHALLTFQATKVFVDESIFKERIYDEKTNILLHVGGDIYAYGYKYVTIH